MTTTTTKTVPLKTGFTNNALQGKKPSYQDLLDILDLSNQNTKAAIATSKRLTGEVEQLKIKLNELNSRLSPVPVIKIRHNPQSPFFAGMVNLR